MSLERAEELTGDLDTINRRIAQLVCEKEEIEKELISELKHSPEGVKTYKLGAYKVTCKTGYNYSLDKKRYEELQELIPSEFNPVKLKMVYQINNNVLKNAEEFANKKDLDHIYEFIKTSPKKLSLTIVSNV